MKKSLLIIAALVLAQINSFAGSVISKTGNITSNETWTKDNQYLLTGFVYVVAPAVLTIEAGTVIKGDKSSKGSLIVERGAKIMAMGTAQAPIVFTSNQAMGSRASGDWGGLIILGNAPVNQVNPTIEGGVVRPYGGINADDNSGIIRYVRIEFPGIALTPDNEINGLTMGGVGRGTEIHHVQVSYSGDDSFEWFGGNVNAKYLVAHRGLDDDFDTDFGFSGNVQFGVIVRDPSVSDVGTTAAPGASNAFESDGDANGTDVSPLTEAKFSNVTVFGPLATPTSSLPTSGTFYRRALHLRRNTSISVYNSVFMGYPIGLFIDNSGAKFVTENIKSGKLQFMNNIISGTKTVADTLKLDLKSASYSKTELDAWFNTGKNDAISENSSLGLPATQGATDFLTKPMFIPNTGSILLIGGGALPTGHDATTYRGAFNTMDWTMSWASFNPQAFNYSVLGGPTITGINDATETNLTMTVSPNPASNNTIISTYVASAGNLSLTILDMKGNLVEELTNGFVGAGTIATPFNTSRLVKGVYIAKAVTGSTVKTVKLVVQ